MRSTKGPKVRSKGQVRVRYAVHYSGAGLGWRALGTGAQGGLRGETKSQETVSSPVPSVLSLVPTQDLP